MNINLEPMPERSSQEILDLVTKETDKILGPDTLAGLKSFLIQPRMEIREWDWDSEHPKFPTWVVAESTKYDYGLVYSDNGFGAVAPWGLVFSSHRNFDADYCWFTSLEAAYLDSRLKEEFEEQREQI